MKFNANKLRSWGLRYKSRSTLEGFRKIVENMPAALMRDSVTYKNAVRFGLVTPTPHPVKFYFEQIGR